MRLYLIGMMGSGKSTLGKKLSDEIGYKFIDMDLYIEMTSGKTIEEIFKDYGEAWFRVYEKNTLKEFKEMDNVIIATGGGIIKDKTNKELLDGKCIFLNVPVDILQKRCDESSIVRPLLLNNSVEEIFNQRKELYDYFKDIEVENIDIDKAIKTIRGELNL